MSPRPNLLHRCFDIFRRQPGFYATIALLPYATLYPALLWVVWFFIVRPAGPTADLRTVLMSMTFNTKMEFLALFLLWITVPFAVAGYGLCRTASDQIACRATLLRDVIAEMITFVPSAFLLGAITGIAAFLSACLLVVPGFIAGAAFSLVVPAAAIEGIGPLAALWRGLSLVGRVFGRVLLLVLGYGLFVFAALILQAILLSASPHVAFLRVAIIIFCGALPLVPLALLNIAMTLLYLEVRTPASSQSLPTAG
jgi:hypothetical protein